MGVHSLMDLDPAVQRNVKEWLDGSYDEETKNTIRSLLEKNPKEIVDAFYTHLVFGTGGLRGVMGVGSNRMNRYTVGAATQGLANYINQQPKPPKGHAVIIGYDSRHHSREFAMEAASILAANAIEVYIFKEIRPTPMVSFGCRFKKCTAGIMITASHNPPEYNGYKVYWEDGAQVLPPHDVNIIREVEKITNPDQVRKLADLSSPKIHWLEEEVDIAYLQVTDSLQNYRDDNFKYGFLLNVVYTSLHGTGITMVPKILKQWGFSSLHLVEKQVIPDGDFPTAHYPNPEEAEAMALGIQTLRETDGDILIATDPDCDRIGVVVKQQDDIVRFNGNQLACLCLHHLCETFLKQNRMLPQDAFIKTVVTTELFQSICDSYQKPCFNVLTGFKYIAEKIREWEKDPAGYRFIFGGEESYGCLYGTYARDKDAIIISALVCEMALQAKKQSRTLSDMLLEIYGKYGYFHEKLLNIKFEESKAGKDQMASGIANIQNSPPKSIGGIKVRSLEDYHRSVKLNLDTGETEPLLLPKTSMLLFWLDDGSKLVIRPSGTEPKIKIYCGIIEKNFKDLKQAEESCEKRASLLADSLARFIKEGTKGT